LAIALNGTEQVPGVQSSATVRLTTAQIATYTIGQIPAPSIAIGSPITGSTANFGLYVDASSQLGQFAYGTGVRTALGVNIGSAGAPVLFNGAGGTPTSLTLTSATAPYRRRPMSRDSRLIRQSVDVTTRRSAMPQGQE
jgi:hypothetical protein